jgi:hypothetical protein
MFRYQNVACDIKIKHVTCDIYVLGTYYIKVFI